MKAINEERDETRRYETAKRNAEVARGRAERYSTELAASCGMAFRLFVVGEQAVIFDPSANCKVRIEKAILAEPRT